MRLFPWKKEKKRPEWLDRVDSVAYELGSHLQRVNSRLETLEALVSQRFTQMEAVTTELKSEMSSITEAATTELRATTRQVIGALLRLADKSDDLLSQVGILRELTVGLTQREREQRLQELGGLLQAIQQIDDKVSRSRFGVYPALEDGRGKMLLVGVVQCPDCNAEYDLQEDCHIGEDTNPVIRCSCGCTLEVSSQGIRKRQ